MEIFFTHSFPIRKAHSNIRVLLVLPAEQVRAASTLQFLILSQQEVIAFALWVRNIPLLHKTHKILLSTMQMLFRLMMSFQILPFIFLLMEMQPMFPEIPLTEQSAAE